MARDSHFSKFYCNVLEPLISHPL